VKKQQNKLIFGFITLAGFVAALIGLFVPYLKVVTTISSKSTSSNFNLFGEELAEAAHGEWITISKIALIVLLVALLIAGIVILYSSFAKKTPNWVNAIGLIAGLVAVVATIAIAGAMIGFGSANRIVEDYGSLKVWGTVGFWLAFIGGACASVCAVLPYFKKK
jgi:hypothetical protein